MDYMEECNYDYIYSSLCFTFGVSMIYPTFKLLRAYIKGEFISTKLLFYSAILLFIIIFVAFILDSIGAFLYCKHPAITTNIDFIWNWFYMLQALVVLEISFLKIYIVFKDSVYALSMTTVRLFAILYSIVFIVEAISIPLVIPIIAPSMDYIAFTVWVFVWYGVLLLIAWLVSSYIYKLIQIHKSSQAILSDNNQMVKTITKTSLLFGISLSTTFILMILINIWYLAFLNPVLEYAIFMICIIDQYTNFLCIILSFSYYQKIYDKMCGCLDSCCYRLWTQYLTKTDAAMVVKDIESADSATDTQRNQEMQM